MAVLLSPARRCLVEYGPVYFPFGGKLSRSALQAYKGCGKTTTKILFLGCLDLKNVLQTIMSHGDDESGGVLSISMNHSCPLLFARNVLILQVISAPEFNINSPDDLNYLWDLWYNLEWPQSTLQRFTMDVSSLIKRGLSEHCSALNKTQLEEIRDIFSGWLSSLSRKLTESSQMKNKIIERKKFVENRGMGDLGGIMASGAVEGTSYESLADWCDVAMETKDFPESAKKKLYTETKLYFMTGNCNTTKLNGKAGLNPTLLEPRTLRWRVNVTSCPFYSYLPLPLEELETSAQEGIATRYCQKTLKNLVAVYRKQQKNVQFHFHLSEDLQFCNFGTTEKFDVIDCSTLADGVGLANLILSASQKLELHPDALLLTESHEWGSVGSTVALYLEESLCAPLSMIPTIYGLRLDNSVELGSTSLMERDYPAGYPPVTLYWRPTPRLENVQLVSSLSLDNCLNKLEKKCYFLEEDRNSSSKENCGFKCYTPFTFNLALNRQAGYGESLFHSKLAPCFALSKKTLEDWANHQPVTLMTASQPFTPVLQSLSDHNKMLFPSPCLRIVLAPFNQYVEQNIRRSTLGLLSVNWAKEIPHTHYIDNFHLVYERNEDGSFRSVKVSFLLPEGHGLEPTYCGSLVDLETGTPIMFMGAIKNMDQQIYDCPYPVVKHCTPPSASFSIAPCSKAQARIISCEESEKDFIVLIITNEAKGLSITTDRQLPCESAHAVTFSFAEPEGMEPLHLRFPYPVLVDGITSNCESELSVEVVLKKAIYEPWPCQFAVQSKCKVDKFVAWKEPKSNDDPSRLMIHVAGQKDNSSLRNGWAFLLNPKKSNQLSPLEEVRIFIGAVFVHAEMEAEYFTVSYKNDVTKPLWHLRVHLPIRTSSCGSPMLLISVVDHRLSEKLIDNGKLPGKKFVEDFRRIFTPKGVDNSLQPSVLMSEDAVSLLRYVLRLNSVKMEPSSWQKENLPLGEYSPFLATFLSPLYLDSQYPLEDDEEKVKDGKQQLSSFNDLFDVPICNPDCCATCRKQSTNKLKCCSKCKLAYYCSVECQKADWKKHKIVCALLGC